MVLHVQLMATYHKCLIGQLHSCTREEVFFVVCRYFSTLLFSIYSSRYIIRVSNSLDLDQKSKWAWSGNTMTSHCTLRKICLFDLILYVHSTIFQLCGTGLPGLSQYLARINVSCSRTQRSDAGEARTRGPSVSSQALYHWATALPILEEEPQNTNSHKSSSKATHSLLPIKTRKDTKYSKACVKRPLKNRQNKDVNDKW